MIENDGGRSTMRYIWLMGMVVILTLLSNSVGLASTCNLTGDWTYKANGQVYTMTLRQISSGGYDYIDGYWDFQKGAFYSGMISPRNTVDGQYSDLSQPGQGVFHFEIIDCNTLNVNTYSQVVASGNELSGRPNGKWVRASTQGVTGLEVTVPDPVNHPLAIQIRVIENSQPVPNAKLKVRALDLQPDNNGKLADYFLASDDKSCTNCASETKEGKTFLKWTDPKLPIGVTTDAKGIAKLEFFLPLEKSEAILPHWNAPIKINISVEYWKTNSTGKESKIAEKKVERSLNIIGVVKRIWVVSPSGEEGNLSKWIGDEGVESEVPPYNTLIKKSDRVKIVHVGIEPGVTLKEGDGISLGDKVRINALGLNDNLSKAPRSIDITVGFFDGFVEKVQVIDGFEEVDFAAAKAEGQFAPRSIRVARSAWNFAKNTIVVGGINEGVKFVLLKALPAAAAPGIGMADVAFKAVATTGAVGTTIWKTLRGPIYIHVESSVVTDIDNQGQLLVTTREGNATIYTNATGDKGFTVPAGKTAVVNGTTLMPILKDTDPDTARQADELLASIEDPIASSPVFAVTGNATGNVSAGNVTPVIPSPSANITAPGGMNQTNLTAPGTPPIPTGMANITPAGIPGPSRNISAPGGRNLTNLTAPGIPIGPAVATAVTPVNNNQLGRASQVGSGQAVNQGITPAGSSNWYKFHASANGIISVNVENVPSDMRPDVTLYDKNFNSFVEKSATSPGDKLSFKTDIPMPGWVYIVVKDADGKAHSEPYTLTVDFNAVQDSYDSNNVLGDAAEIKPGEAIKASICPHGELDWYKLHTDANGIISVDVENVPSDMRPDVQLYDKNFNRFEEKSATSPGGSLKFTRDIPAQGWVYVAISDADGKAHSEPYTLTVNFDAVQDSYDPNNVLGDAAEIKPGEAIKASICPHGELDWYKLRADAGGIISVNVNAVPKDMRPGASLYDKNFNRFEDKQATNAADSLSFDKDLPAPGWAYIAIYDADGKAHSEPYTLTTTLKSG